MNKKALMIKAKISPVPVTEPAIYAVQNNNTAIIQELSKIQRKASLTTHIVMDGAQPLATIVFKYSENKLVTIVTRHVNGTRAMYKKDVRGVGFDRETHALSSCEFFPAGGKRFTLDSGGKRWYHQLEERGFKVWQTL